MAFAGLAAQIASRTVTRSLGFETLSVIESLYLHPEAAAYSIKKTVKNKPAGRGFCMVVRRSQKRTKVVARDPEKENVLKGLGSILEGAGFSVRREKLKRGPGWRVVSGTCRALDRDSTPRRFIFVDRALSQDDQIAFLLGRITELKVKPDAQIVGAFPERIQAQLAHP